MVQVLACGHDRPVWIKFVGKQYIGSVAHASACATQKSISTNNT